MNSEKIDRRTFLGTGAAGLILGANRAWASDTKPGAVVETTSGKIRGLVIDKVNALRASAMALPRRAPTASCRLLNLRRGPE
jgi:hypothetical protein